MLWFFVSTTICAGTYQACEETKPTFLAFPLKQRYIPPNKQFPYTNLVLLIGTSRGLD